MNCPGLTAVNCGYLVDVLFILKLLAAHSVRYCAIGDPTTKGRRAEHGSEERVVMAAVRHKVVWGHAAEVSVPTLGPHRPVPLQTRSLRSSLEDRVAPFSCSRMGRERN